MDIINQQGVSVVIPIFNECDQIPHLIHEINVFCHEQQSEHYRFQFIFVDDGSTDNSFKQLEKYCPALEYYKLIRLSRNYGAHAAIRAGASCADGNYMTMIPADLQISLNDMLLMFNKITQGFDVVWVVRSNPDIGRLEKMFSGMYSGLMRKFVHPDFPTEGIETMMISHKVLKQFNKQVESNSSFVLQILTYGYRSHFLNLKKYARQVGKSKWTFKKKLKLFIDSFVAFSYVPIRLVSIVGISFFIFGLSWTIYVILRKLIYDDIPNGWSALVSILMVGFGLTNISLGIIAEYLWRTLDVSRKRPVFLIDEIIDNKKE